MLNDKFMRIGCLTSEGLCTAGVWNNPISTLPVRHAAFCIQNTQALFWLVHSLLTLFTHMHSYMNMNMQRGGLCCGNLVVSMSSFPGTNGRFLFLIVHESCYVDHKPVLQFGQYELKWKRWQLPSPLEFPLYWFVPLTKTITDCFLFSLELPTTQDY